VSITATATSRWWRGLARVARSLGFRRVGRWLTLKSQGAAGIRIPPKHRGGQPAGAAISAIWLVRISATETTLDSAALGLTDQLVTEHNPYNPALSSGRHNHGDRSAMWVVALRPRQHDSLSEELRILWNGKATVTMMRFSTPAEVVCQLP
jgi:hypothetical protein